MKLLPWFRGLGAACALLLPLLPATPAVAQTPDPEIEVDDARKPLPPVGYPVLPGIWRLHGNDPSLPTDDLEPLRRIIGNASVVALGENAHTSGGHYILKHRVFRYLVENMGFRVFAMESNWTGVDRAGRYVQTCEGSPEESIRGHWAVFQSTELRDLVKWMCEWNRSHSDPKDKLHYFGFDIQQPRDDGPALISSLRKIGIAADHPWIAGINGCEQVTGVIHPLGQTPREQHDQCLRALADIDRHFQRNGKAILKVLSKDEFAIAKVNVVGLRAWEIGYNLIQDDFSTAYTIRDEAMAYTFNTLRNMRYPKAKTMIWAANSHVSRTVLPNRARPLGSFLARSLGRNYVTFGLTSYATEIDYPQYGCGLIDLRPNSAEEKFHELGEEALLIDLAFPGTKKPFLPRGIYNVGPEPHDPHRNWNGMFYLAHSPKMNPLNWPNCQ